MSEESSEITRKINLFDRYDVEIKKLLYNGYTESIPHDASIHKTRVYLTHHPVTKNAEQLHVVFDCAIQYQGAPLNSLCLQGPTLPNKLFDILLMFHQFPHAVMAMYNQIQILPEDQDALRFLWVDDDTIAKYCMTSQLWCSSSSAYAFNKTEELTPVVTVRSMIKYSLFVDDLMWSTNAS